jgi:polyhydroxyalkanoate synthesis regulator phasin
MSLITEDLQAIQTIVQQVVDTRVQRIVYTAIEDSDLRTANAFAEVHEKFEALDNKLTAQIQAVDDKLSSQIQIVDDKLTVKDGKLENTVERVDMLEQAVKRLQLKTT